MTWTKEAIKQNLLENDQWVVRGILAIYDRQTFDEQASHITKHNNGIGFNGVDAEILTSFAEQIIKWMNGGKAYSSPLSPKQMEIARRKIIKYSRQLAEIANRKD